MQYNTQSRLKPGPGQNTIPGIKICSALVINYYRFFLRKFGIIRSQEILNYKNLVFFICLYILSIRNINADNLLCCDLVIQPYSQSISPTVILLSSFTALISISVTDSQYQQLSRLRRKLQIFYNKITPASIPYRLPP